MTVDQPSQAAPHFFTESRRQILLVGLAAQLHKHSPISFSRLAAPSCCTSELKRSYASDLKRLRVSWHTTDKHLPGKSNIICMLHASTFCMAHCKANTAVSTLAYAAECRGSPCADGQNEFACERVVHFALEALAALCQCWAGCNKNSCKAGCCKLCESVWLLALLLLQQTGKMRMQ